MGVGSGVFEAVAPLLSWKVPRFQVGKGICLGKNSEKSGWPLLLCCA